MSKSRGTGISPLRYLELGMNPEWLRYYIAAKLNSQVEDIDFNPDDFVARVNSDLVGKYINIASRAAGFLTKRFGGSCRRPAAPRAASCSTPLRAHAPIGHGDCYDEREYGKALRESMAAGRPRQRAMSTQHKPWELAKDEPRLAELHEVCSRVCIEAFRLLTVLPEAGAAGAGARGSRRAFLRDPPTAASTTP